VSRLPPRAELSWSESGEPRAAHFDDVYFSREGGLAESETVFLSGCDLPDAWRGKKSFSICELGFGTGLNIIATWRAWKKTRSPHAILHISSIEAFPLEATEAARALSQFPEVADLAAKLIECWPVRAYAPQRLWFPEDGFALTLHIGDVAELLAGMSARFDAWFLDGFAPSRNPAMWSETVFAQIARLSALDARLATFTVAGEVRRGLERVGFAVEKKPGFGAKRERLQGRLNSAVAPPPRRSLYPYAACEPKRVGIVGAGIAGASCALALARRGIEVVVLDAAASLNASAGASFNPAGLVMPRLDRGGVLREYFIAAFLHAVRTYEMLGVFERVGVAERAAQDAEAALADLLADPPLPDDWFAALGVGSVLHKRAGLVRPLDAIRLMLADAELLTEAPVQALERADQGWVLKAPDGRVLLKADAVILACGAALKSFAPASFLPIELSRGQIEWGLATPPAHALTCGSYVAPYDGGVLFGATFDEVPALTEEAEQIRGARGRNLAALAALAPEIAASLDPATLKSRAALRATTPDFAPIAGLLPDAAAWLAQNGALVHGREPNLADPPPHAGVYVLGALGARGLTNAPLLGERLAAEICGEPQILRRAELDALHPARFLHRALKRGLIDRLG
jgi:tRNA 5-methylaminomethyl-2-thiouridine biosynthesis bifunctional protein